MDTLAYVMKTLSSLIASEALALGVNFQDWLQANTRSEERAVKEAIDALRDAQDQSLSEWKRAERDKEEEA